MGNLISIASSKMTLFHTTYKVFQVIGQCIYFFPFPSRTHTRLLSELCVVKNVHKAAAVFAASVTHCFRTTANHFSTNHKSLHHIFMACDRECGCAERHLLSCCRQLGHQSERPLQTGKRKNILRKTEIQ